MNPQNPSREDIELRITMLLLGELPAEEAEALRPMIAQDPILKKLHDELRSTIGLVREVEKNPAYTASENSAPLKLSDERREKLLTHFKTPRPQESFWIRPMRIPRLIPVLAAIAGIAVLAALLMPALSAAKKKSSRSFLSGVQQTDVLAETERAKSELQDRTWSGDNARREPFSTPAKPVDSAPTSVTLGPETVLAPPPAQIVLPTRGSPDQTAVITGSLAASGNGGVYSQNIIGYVNTPLGSGTPVTAPAALADSLGIQTSGETQTMTLSDSPSRMEQLEKQRMIPPSTPAGEPAGITSNYFVPVIGFVGGSGGGVGGPLPTANSTLAWDASDLDRLRRENKPAFQGEMSKSEVAAYTLASIPNAMPETGLPTGPGEELLALDVPEKRFAAGNDFTKGAARLRGTEPALDSKHGFYKITPLPGRRAAVVGDKGQAAPLAMNDTMQPNSGLIVLPPAEMPAPPAGTQTTGAFNFQTGESAAGNRDGGAVAGTFYRETRLEGKDINASVTPSVVAPPVLAGTGEVDKSVGGRSDLSGINGYTGGTTFAAQKLANGTALDSFQTGLSKKEIASLRYLTTTNLAKLAPPPAAAAADLPVRRAPADAPVPQPEILTSNNAFSTFSLNVSDVSFKLAEASLEKGQLPDAASIRSEEFINAFDYRDPEAAAGQPMAFAAERARYPFAHNRELLRFSIKTAAAGRPAGRALNLVLLLDNSGSMERADRVAIIREALRVLAGQLQPQDTVSVVTFARTARLWVDGVAGDKAGETLAQVGGITPEGGTNLEEAMRLAYETAHRHYLANGMNRVVLLTDGAANLGNVDPAVLKQNVEAQRKQGIALDCFGIGFDGYDDNLLEQLSRNGDGRYAFINSQEEAGTEFAAKLAGALQIAASDVKVQVEFNPQRVISYRQIGYAKHQLTKEQFRDNTVDAAEIAAQEAGNALYTVETKPDGSGPVATVRVRYKVPGTSDYHEWSWDVAYEGNVPALEQASAAMRLAGTASAFSEWLAASPFAQEVTPDELLKIMSGVPAVYGADERPKKLEWMIRQAKSLSGK